LVNNVFTENQTLAELRTLSLCDSDLYVQNFHRELSFSSQSPAVSYSSGPESQQSISVKSLYDNVDVEPEPKRINIDSITPKFLMPPIGPLKSSLVNRSKSFQETAPSRKHLSPRSNKLLRQNLPESNIIEDRFENLSGRSSTPFGSTLSESLPDVQNNILVQPDCSCEIRNNGPFMQKLLRRLLKLSLQWPKCKKVSRGRSIANYGILISFCVFPMLTYTFLLWLILIFNHLVQH